MPLGALVGARPFPLLAGVPLVGLSPLLVVVLVVLLAVAARTGGAPALVAVEGDALRIRPRGAVRVWAFAGPLDVPLRQVLAVAWSAQPGLPPGVRTHGTALPGVCFLGTFADRSRGIRERWLTFANRPVLVLELAAGTGFTRVVAQVADPQATCDQLQAVLARA
ncbi:hypothetical protein [Aciditerrimonas ferrireducens]|uniref:hypothetical protein n=1 Tax=Aciditerrimonas ferrireducens TaxID=667306 RepID=UPI00200540D3|nr:hypothetical protein [Aciditerrimonas ferrireducens]MCK4177991.1 hypothetical protein [Aciditerrimonas ferrireducens]